MENKIKNKENNGFLKRYLWIFLIYVVLFLWSIVYQAYEQNIYPYEETDFFLSTFVFGMIFIIFQVYNIIILIKMFKKRISRKALLLSLSEFLPWLYIFLPSFILGTDLPGTNFLTGAYFIVSLKILQLIFVIYLLNKIKK